MGEGFVYDLDDIDFLFFFSFLDSCLMFRVLLVWSSCRGITFVSILETAISRLLELEYHNHLSLAIRDSAGYLALNEYRKGI